MISSVCGGCLCGNAAPAARKLQAVIRKAWPLYQVCTAHSRTCKSSLSYLQKCVQKQHASLFADNFCMRQQSHTTQERSAGREEVSGGWMRPSAVHQPQHSASRLLPIPWPARSFPRKSACRGRGGCAFCKGEAEDLQGPRGIQECTEPAESGQSLNAIVAYACPASMLHRCPGKPQGKLCQKDQIDIRAPFISSILACWNVAK